MHRVAKNNKRGFTLLELVLVISMLVMLAAVLAINAGGIYSRANNKAGQVTGTAQAVRGGIDASESLLKNRYHF